MPPQTFNLDIVPPKLLKIVNVLLITKIDANQGAGHADHTHGNWAEVAQDPLSLPSGPITRLRTKRFKEALNGLIQERANSKKTKMGSNNNQSLVNVIKAIEKDN